MTVPGPLVVIVSVRAGAALKLATMLRLALTTTVSGLTEPLALPLQLVNRLPAAGVAVSVTDSPAL